MHALFIPYGIKTKMDFFAEELNHFKLPLRVYKEGEEDRQVVIQCQIREMPFGIWDFVFPKEYADQVLTALRFNLNEYPQYNFQGEFTIMGFGVKPIEWIRKILKIEPVPEFKTDKVVPILFDYISIIPIGVKYDAEVTEADGFSHEAI